MKKFLLLTIIMLIGLVNPMIAKADLTQEEIDTMNEIDRLLNLLSGDDSVDEDMQTIYAYVSMLESQMPMTMADGMEMTKAYYDDANHAVVLKIDIDGSKYPYQTVATGIDVKKQNIVNTFRQNQLLEPLIESFVNTNTSLIYCYDFNNGQTVDVEITADDFKEGENKDKFDVKASAREAVALEVEATQSKLPMYVDFMTTLNKLYIAGHTVMYVYSLDDVTYPSMVKMLDVDTLKKNTADNWASNSVTKGFAKNLALAGYNIENFYIGKSGENTFSVIFTPEELDEIAGF